MDGSCGRVLKRIRPIWLIPKVIEEEEMFDPPSSPEECYAVPLLPTPPSTSELSQQFSPPLSQETVFLESEKTVILMDGEEIAVLGQSEETIDVPAGMEVQNSPPPPADENTPPPPPPTDENTPPADENREPCGSDDFDAPISVWVERIEFFECLESAVLHLLNKVLTLYVEEKCNGCHIMHPSQRQHTCLLDPPDDIYQIYFHSVVRKLWNPMFIRSIKKYMECYGFYESYGIEEIRPSTEILLLSYRTGGSIYERIYRMYDNLKLQILNLRE